MGFFGLFSVPMWVIILLALIVLYLIPTSCSGGQGNWAEKTTLKLFQGIFILRNHSNTRIPTSYSSRHFGVFKEMGVKGPKPWPVIGNIYFKKSFTESQEELRQTYGRVYGLHEGMNPILMVGDCDMLREITVKEFSNFRNRRNFGTEKFTEPPVRNFLTMAVDDDWRHNRNTVTPTFSSGKLKRMTDMITDAGETMVKWLKVKAGSGKPVEMKELTGAFTMDVIAATAFGIKLDTQSTPNDPFIKYANKFFEVSLASFAIISILFFPFLIPLLKTFKKSISPKDSVAFFSNIVTQALEERRQNPGTYSDFLQLMINAEKEARNVKDSDDHEQDNGNVETDEDGLVWKDKRKGKGLTDGEIIAHSILFFIAGYDTTASTLAALFYHLAMNPDYMDQLIEEIDEHFPDGKRPDYESVNKLPYLEKVIMEGLRINPPLGRMERVCNKETTVNGIKIPVGMGVALPIYQIHHDPGYWADPETFDPERFTPEKRQKHHPLQWIPFGYGPRNCIGMRLAQFEMKIAIIMLLQNFRVVPNEKTKPLKFGPFGILSRTIDGIWLTIENRK